MTRAKRKRLRRQRDEDRRAEAYERIFGKRSDKQREAEAARAFARYYGSEAVGRFHASMRGVPYRFDKEKSDETEA